MNWFYLQDEKQVGPVSGTTLMELHACGVIENETLIREENRQTWKTYGETQSEDRTDASQNEIHPHCPGCSQKFRAESSDIGKQATCPSCGTAFVIQVAQATPPPLPDSVPANRQTVESSRDSMATRSPSRPPLSQSDGATQSPIPTNCGDTTRPVSEQPRRLRGRALRLIVIGSVAAVAVLLILVVGLISALRESYTERLVDDADRIAFQTAGSPDWQKMVSLLQQAAERGNHEAIFKLGTCYNYGRGVPKDPTEAARLFRKAAEAGFAEAQYNLAVCYAQGQGVELNETEMLKWLKLAVEQELPQAQHSLGTLCMLGNAVPTDKKRGVELISQAANKGIAVAQYDLSLFHETGNGVPRDLVQAYKWATIATRSGFPGGEAALVELGKQMDQAQIREAEILAGQWKSVNSHP